MVTTLCSLLGGLSCGFPSVLCFYVDPHTKLYSTIQASNGPWGCLHLPRDDPRGNLSQPQTLLVPAPLVAHASVGKAAMP